MIFEATRAGNVDVIERLAALKIKLEEYAEEREERARKRDAERAFIVAMAEAQRRIRPVVADRDNTQTRSRYASYAALDKAVREIAGECGLSLSFNEGTSPRELEVRLLCEVSHIAGHSKVFHRDIPADGKGPKGNDVMTRTHASKSAVSYGMSDLLRMVFNIPTVPKEDDDGNAASRPLAETRRAPSIMPREPGPTITAEQAMVLIKLISDEYEDLSDADRQITKFCQTMGVSKIPDIPAALWDDAESRLATWKARRNAAKKEEAPQP